MLNPCLTCFYLLFWPFKHVVESQPLAFWMSIAPCRRLPECTTHRPFTCLYLPRKTAERPRGELRVVVLPVLRGVEHAAEGEVVALKALVARDAEVEGDLESRLRLTSNHGGADVALIDMHIQVP